MCTTEEEEKKLLQMVEAFHEYGIECVVDILNSIDINSCGGPANWLSNKIYETDKIVVILNESYLQVRNLVLSNEIVFYKTILATLPRSYRAKCLFKISFFWSRFFLIHTV